MDSWIKTKVTFELYPAGVCTSEENPFQFLTTMQKNHKRLRERLYTFLMIFFALLAIYPFAAWLYNSYVLNGQIASHDEAVTEIPDTTKEEMRARARDYNGRLLASGRFLTEGGEGEDYESFLNFFGDGVMGSLTIEKIGVNLPVYHGTSDEVLAAGVGHLAATSLPVGGTGSHAVLSGHRGLSSAMMLSRLNELEVGDIFELTVLGEDLYYQVDSIETVLPDELDAITLDPSEDRVTLVTCTPFGLNTHRLLVSGIRTEAPGVPQEKSYRFFILPGAILLIILAGLILSFWKKKKRA